MISGFFDSEYGLPHVWVRLGIGGGESRTLVPFVIDTGATTTALHAHDALRRLGMDETDLDPRRWPEDRLSLSGGVGGAAPYRVLEAAYEFRREGRISQIVTASIELGALNTEHLPSLLGWDVLRHFRLDLNASRGKVALLPP